MARRAEQLGLGRELDQPAQVHHAHVVGHVAHHDQVVRDEQAGESALALQIHHQVEHLGLHGDVERRRRLVADEEFGAGRDRARDRDALALAARELVRKLAHVHALEAHRREQSGHVLGRLGGRHQPLLEQRFGDDVRDAPARVEAGVRILEDHLHAPPQRARGLERAVQRGLHIQPAQPGAAVRRGLEADHQARQRALAAARFADQRQRASALDREAHVVDRMHALRTGATQQAIHPGRVQHEGLAQAACLHRDRGGGRGRCRRRCVVVRHAAGLSTMGHQQAARVRRTRASSGRSSLQRGLAFGQRG